MLNTHKLEYYLLFSVGNLLNFLGTISKNFPSRFLAYISYQLIGIRRKTVESNLSRAFPEKSRSEIKRLAFKIYEAIAVTFLEILRLNKMNPDKIKKIFSDEGFEKIHRKLEQDKGLIFLTGHFGNWEIGAIATNIYLGQGLSVLVKKQKNPYVANWLTAFRERLGNTEITLGTSVKELYKAVKSRKIVGIVGDQRGTREGVKVKFFGETTYTFPGTAAIALRTGCPVVVMLCPRQSDGSYKAIIEEIDHSEFTGSENEKIQQFNQKYMSILEGVIRQYPEQWFWMHNIWKYSNRIS